MTSQEDEAVSGLFDIATAKIEEQRETIGRLRAALIAIRDDYANQDISHAAFRVDAYQRALGALVRP